jgi:hypothetical protein
MSARLEDYDQLHLRSLKLIKYQYILVLIADTQNSGCPSYSSNWVTPFYFLSHSLHVSAPTGHLQVRYTIRYVKDYLFNTTDPLHIRDLI